MVKKIIREIDLFDFTSFLASTFLKFLAHCGAVISIYFNMCIKPTNNIICDWENKIYIPILNFKSIIGMLHVSIPYLKSSNVSTEEY